MSKILVVPDIHLKPWIYDKASEKISGVDYIVLLGDIVDDWNQEFNASLYTETFDKTEEFITANNNVFMCYGNHDISYLWNKLETGFSPFMQENIIKRMKQLQDMLGNRLAFVHRFDNVIFSHAGIVEELTGTIRYKHNNEKTDSLIEKINNLCVDELWCDKSPLWARAIYGHYTNFDDTYLQVVGHTPVAAPILKDGILYVDVFSTYSNGEPIGNERFVFVDSENMEWNVL